MSKKDYELIARAILVCKPDSTKREIAESIASELRYDNPRFDRARFLQACGVYAGTTI